MLYLDIRKTFDTVAHHILLKNTSVLILTTVYHTCISYLSHQGFHKAASWGHICLQFTLMTCPIALLQVNLYYLQMILKLFSFSVAITSLCNKIQTSYQHGAWPIIFSTKQSLFICIFDFHNTLLLVKPLPLLTITKTWVSFSQQTLISASITMKPYIKVQYYRKSAKVHC